jgi:hypothetical protein
MELLVIYSDFYKMLIEKRNQNKLNKEDYFYLQELDEVSNVDDIIIEISAVPSFLEQMLRLSIEFNELSFLGKVNVMNSLSEDDYNFLNSITSIEDINKKTYLRDIELNDYINHIENENKQLTQDEIYVNTDNFTEEICGFLINLSKYNYENYANNIKDLLIYYYEYAKYTLDNNKQITVGSNEDITSIVSLFEKMDIEFLIEEILYNHDFMFCIVDFYINTFPLNQICYQDENVTYKQIDDYIEANLDENIKQKVNYKKTRI